MNKDVDRKIDRVEDDIENVEDDVKDVEDDIDDVEDDMRNTKKQDIDIDLENNSDVDNENDNDVEDEGNEKMRAESIDQIDSYKSPYAKEGSFFSRLSYDGMAGYAGFNIGGTTTFNLGFRPSYRLDSSNLRIAPEAYFGFGNPSSFGIFANLITDFPVNIETAKIGPYVGAGVGFIKIEKEDEDRLRPAINLLAGVNLFNVANGRMFAEFATRNFFNFNQLIAGYRLAF